MDDVSSRPHRSALGGLVDHVDASMSSSVFQKGQRFAVVAACRSQSVSPIGVWWGFAVLTLLQTAGKGDSGVSMEKIGFWWGFAVLTLLQTAGKGDSGVSMEKIGFWWGFAVLTLLQMAGNGDFTGFEQPFSRRENVQPRRTHRSWPRS
jgi:hypothetical protein